VSYQRRYIDGINPRFHRPDEPRPAKYQLLLEFTDDATLSACVQMYGGVGACQEGELDNPYY
jgi:formamidopyrimidine-DNA glycosylase